MDSTNWISKKVALLGSHAVGKTSLISRFVYQKFSDKYLTTIGLKVDKKTIDVKDHRIDLVIWDIAGRDNTSEVPYYYLRGCSGIIYVIDTTRESTYKDLDQKVKELKEMVSGVEVVIAANKSDLFLSDEENASEEDKVELLLKNKEFVATLESMPMKPHFIKSAKTGMNVENMFMGLANSMLSKEQG
jgi:small GTP-binding protein